MKKFDTDKYFIIHTNAYSDVYHSIIQNMLTTFKHGHEFYKSHAWDAITHFMNVDRDDNGETILLVLKKFNEYTYRNSIRNPYVTPIHSPETIGAKLEAKSLEAIMKIITSKLHMMTNRILKTCIGIDGQAHKWSFKNKEAVAFYGANPSYDIDAPRVCDVVGFYDLYNFTSKFLRRKDGLPQRLIGVPRSEELAARYEFVRNERIRLQDEHDNLISEMRKEASCFRSYIDREYAKRIEAAREKYQTMLSELEDSLPDRKPQPKFKAFAA